MDPASPQSDAPMPRAQKQVVAQHPLDVAQNLRTGRRMKPMAAIVHRDAVELESSGIATDGGALFHHGDVESAALGKPKRRAEASRSGTEYSDRRPHGVWIRRRAIRRRATCRKAGSHVNNSHPARAPMTITASHSSPAAITGPGAPPKGLRSATRAASRTPM